MKRPASMDEESGLSPDKKYRKCYKEADSPPLLDEIEQGNPLPFDYLWLDPDSGPEDWSFLSPTMPFAPDCIARTRGLVALPTDKPGAEGSPEAEILETLWPGMHAELLERVNKL